MVDTIHIALNNLEKNTGIETKYNEITGNKQKDIDGEIAFKYRGKIVKRFVKVKNELRYHHIPQILDIAEQYKPLVLIARIIFPKLKEELRKERIDYLDANGNIFIHEEDLLIHIEGNKNLNMEKEKGNRAFMKTGLKTVFHFLNNNELVNHTYREIAEETGVALGNVKYVMDGLRQKGYLLDLDKKRFKLINKEDLLEKWINAYAVRLKPTLFIERFRFLREDDFLNWKNINLNTGKTVWGGQPGGDILTKYLKPEKFTLYTQELRINLIKNYRFMPDPDGTIFVYKKFWGDIKENELFNKIAPPLLVYADLMIQGDRRCMETAKKIHDEYIKDKL